MKDGFKMEQGRWCLTPKRCQLSPAFAGFCPDSQNGCSDVAKIEKVSETSKFSRNFLLFVGKKCQSVTIIAVWTLPIRQKNYHSFTHSLIWVHPSVVFTTDIFYILYYIYNIYNIKYKVIPPYFQMSERVKEWKEWFLHLRIVLCVSCLRARVRSFRARVRRLLACEHITI